METNEGKDDAAKGAAPAATGAASNPAKEDSIAAAEMVDEGAPVAPPASAEPAKTADAGDKPADAADAEKPAEEAHADKAANAEVNAIEEKAAEDKPADAAKVEAIVPVPPPIRGSTAGIISLCIIVGAVLLSIFIMRRQEATGGRRGPDQQQHAAAQREVPWKVGQKVPITVTALPDDADNLECASSQEVGTRHCAYESTDKPWGKGDNTDDKLLLRPYATTGKRRIIAAGFWSSLKTPLPDKRFTAQCTFEVEGKIEKPSVRFKKATPFREVHDSWAAGTLSECTLQAPK